MINPWHLLAVFFAAAIAFAISVTYVLVIDASGPRIAPATAGWVFPPDRTDCKEIFGTAYRSDRERQWFNDNCSSWSQNVGIVPDPAGGPAAGAAPGVQQQATGPGPEGRDCNQTRGTPYRSPAERDWYLANCQGQAPATTAQAQTAGPDRTDCNAIRGTPYRSDAERAWYLANCQQVQRAQVAQPQTQPQHQPGNNGNGTGRGNGNR
jgi:hypothetical protein